MISNFIEVTSRWLNVVFLQGNVNESISARSYRLRDTSKAWYTSYKVINKIFFWQNNHCRGAFNNRRREMQEFLDND